jgi:hypothetical protein
MLLFFIMRKFLFGAVILILLFLVKADYAEEIPIIVISVGKST